MKVVSLITARGGSKGVPRKNTKLIGKHPLVAYSIGASVLSAVIDETVVTTDCSEIADISRQYGASVPFLRPSGISQDDSLDIEFVRHYLEFLRSKNEPFPDLLVHLRPTTPLREASVVDAAILAMMDNVEATSLRSMERTNVTPFKLFYAEGRYARPYMHMPGFSESSNLPRQKFGSTYDPNGVVDIIRPEVVASTGTLHGDRMLLFECEHVSDIDEESDYEEAAAMLSDDRYKCLLDFLNGAVA